MAQADGFHVQEATIADAHNAFSAGTLTARQLVEAYLRRIDDYDKKGPELNAVISLNPRALDEADRLDAAYKSAGFVGPLHGIPVVVKDQADVREMPTTLGSILFKDHRPGRDCFVAARLRQAGAILLAKTTLGELGAGDTHGSLFGSTRNPYDVARTVGGSSGGTGSSISANFAMVGVGQEGLASIRRPATWNGITGMRPSIGLVSRTGVWDGWPSMNGSLGPMARTVTDLAKLLDVMVGYDPEDPATAYGVGRTPKSFAIPLDASALKGARLGILREPMGFMSEPQSEDFSKIDEVFERAVGELAKAGAIIIDPITIPDLNSLLKRRVFSSEERDLGWEVYFRNLKEPLYASREAAAGSARFRELRKSVQERWLSKTSTDQNYDSLKARESLLTNMLKTMADHDLDAIVHKAVEHQPTLIADGINPPYVNQKGAPHLNTFLQSVPSIVVPAGFTRDRLPAGVTFLGRPYDDAQMLRYAFAYEEATHHRRPPPATP